MYTFLSYLISSLFICVNVIHTTAGVLSRLVFITARGLFVLIISICFFHMNMGL